MKLHAEGGAVRVTSYGAGWFALGGEVVRRSAVLRADGTLEPWPPATVAELAEEHLRRLLLDPAPEVVLLGTGERQAFPAPGLLRPFAERGVGLEVMDTAAACRTWNVLAAEGRQVAAGLLLNGAGSRAGPAASRPGAPRSGA